MSMGQLGCVLLNRLLKQWHQQPRPKRTIPNYHRKPASDPFSILWKRLWNAFISFPIYRILFYFPELSSTLVRSTSFQALVDGSFTK